MLEPVRPSIRLLSDQLVDKILDEAFETLATIGIFMENKEAVHLLSEAGATPDAAGKRLRIPRAVLERSLASAPSTITLYDSTGDRSYVVGGDHVHFDPGSAALKLFDHTQQRERDAITSDLIRFSGLVQQLDNFHFQSTGIISTDVPQQLSDCYRLFIALQFCSKPAVTGTFIVEGFQPMFEILAAVRGGARQLRERPLAIFDACPSPPLRWSNLTTQSVIDCARAGIPSEFVSMPLAGAAAPATLAGSVVQHTAENLAGVAIAQSAQPGAPVVFGGSPAIFDMRTGTTPMGAIETMMLDSSAAQVGKRLGLPTHAYMGLSDAKCVDAQAGLESGIGAVLAALSGVNVVSGGGMMNFESCQSLEKLVIDNDICGMAYRLIAGVRQRDDSLALELFKDLGERMEFITHEHTLRWYRHEQMFPAVIDRGNYQQWVDAGKPSLADRASRRVQTLLAAGPQPVLSAGLRVELRKIMEAHGKRYGLAKLPELIVA